MNLNSKLKFYVVLRRNEDVSVCYFNLPSVCKYLTSIVCSGAIALYALSVLNVETKFSLGNFADFEEDECNKN